MHKYSSFKQRGLQLFVAAMFIFSLFAVSNGTVFASNGSMGIVYTMTNASTNNAIQVYFRAANGTLTLGSSFDTGGSGTGTGLGSQGAIALDSGRQFLYAVNAGSSEISLFAVQGNKLKLLDKVSSMGSTPVSLTVNNGVLYVLDAGGTGNIAGFWVSPSGHLTFISGSVRPLSNLGMGAAASPEEIGFSPDGQHLLVTEKGSNNIDVYNVRDGLATGPIVVTSSGLAPYGFGFHATRYRCCLRSS